MSTFLRGPCAAMKFLHPATSPQKTHRWNAIFVSSSVFASKRNSHSSTSDRHDGQMQKQPQHETKEYLDLHNHTNHLHHNPHDLHHHSNHLHNHLQQQHDKSSRRKSEHDLPRWIPPARWLPDHEHGIDYRQRLKYDLGSWPKKPLPPHLEARLMQRLSKLEFTHPMLSSIAERMSELPKKRIESHYHTGRRAAVMLPLCVVDSKPSVLLNLRSHNVSTHKGQVCFPGGHLDLSDECMEGCAQRECEEELGVRVEAPRERALWEQEWRKRPYYPRSNILGRLPNCVAVTGTLVTPIVGFLGKIDLNTVWKTTNRDEIAEVFSMTLEELLDPRTIVHEDIHMGNMMPAFVSGKHRVWGLTAFILHHFLMEVMLPSILTCSELDQIHDDDCS